MSLNWNFTGCPTWKPTGEVDKEDGKKVFAMHLPDGTAIPWAVTDALIWATMVVGLGWGIKEEGKKGTGIEEFVFRVMAYQSVVGSLLWRDRLPRFITPEEIRAHRGMDTNVATITRRQFLTKLGATIERTVEATIRVREEEAK